MLSIKKGCGEKYIEVTLRIKCSSPHRIQYSKIIKVSPRKQIHSNNFVKILLVIG